MCLKLFLLIPIFINIFAFIFLQDIFFYVFILSIIKLTLFESDFSLNILLIICTIFLGCNYTCWRSA